MKSIWKQIKKWTFESLLPTLKEEIDVTNTVTYDDGVITIVITVMAFDRVIYTKTSKKEV